MGGVPWGGSEALWSETASRLKQQGHHVAASVLRWPSRPAPLVELARQGIPIAFRARGRNFLGRALRKYFPPLASGPIDASQQRWLERSAFDLLVVSQGGPWDGVPWMLACRQAKVPYCAIVHANSEAWWPLDSRLADIEAGMTGARRVFFVSHANHRLMEAQIGRRLDQAAVVANPCAVNRDSAAPWPPPDGEIRLACVGRLAPQAKGQDVLLQVLAQPKWRQRPIRLNVYGTGPSERAVKALATFLAVPRVTFHGHVSDIREIWSANHALVLPSRHEGLPLTIVEAMVCGRPVITTDVAGNTELVDDEVNGFVAAAPTVSLLDEAMERAWRRRAEWPDLGARARADALRRLPDDPVGDFARTLVDLVGRPAGANAATTADSTLLRHTHSPSAAGEALAAAHPNVAGK